MDKMGKIAKRFRLGASLLSLLLPSLINHNAIAADNSDKILSRPVKGRDITVSLPAEKTVRITFDRYSAMIDSRRFLIWSGEFDPFRLPSPSLWQDIFEKMKAIGFNTVTIQLDWAYHSPAPGVYDFNGIRDIDRLLSMAKVAGLYVVVRIGPYADADLSRGGFPGWLTRQKVDARSDDPVYLAAVDEWLTRVNAIISRHQYDGDKGNVILYQVEDRLGDPSPVKQRYMAHLYAKARHDGITLPIFHNETGPVGDWLSVARSGEDVASLIDLHGFSINTTRFCDTQNQPLREAAPPDLGYYNLDNSASFLKRPATSLITIEDGSADYWGSNEQYNCLANSNDERHEMLILGNNLINGLTNQTLRMVYGGINWGWLGQSGRITSFDYGAPIDEARNLRPKADGLKRLGQFISTFSDITKMMPGSVIVPTSSHIRVLHNVNPDTNSHLFFITHKPANSLHDSKFTFSVALPDGTYTLPEEGNLELNGHDSKYLIAGFNLGRNRLVYSTSQFQTMITQGEHDIALFNGRQGEAGEIVLRYETKPRVTVIEGDARYFYDPARHDLRLNYIHGGLTRIKIENGGPAPLILLIGDEKESARFSRFSTDAGDVLVFGPSLVRQASSTDLTLSLKGDTGSQETLEVWAPPAITTLEWNSHHVAFSRNFLNGNFIAKDFLPEPENFTLPDLMTLDWQAAEGTPEARPNFDDSHWQKADDTDDSAIISPPEGQPNLNADSYGFHDGDIWYRGHFVGDPQAKSLTLHYGAGGSGFLQLWMDGQFLGENEIENGLSQPSTRGSFRINLPESAQKAGDHVFSVMIRLNGHREDNADNNMQRAPSGLIAASLSDPSGAAYAVPISWRVQGNLGGENLLDTDRGALNNGGQFGERSGWHLPGYSDSNWSSADMTRLSSTPGTTWYRSHVKLNLPKENDITLGLTIGDGHKIRSKSHYRMLIFVNGWNIGQYIAHIGPQTVFSIPAGIIDYNGDNLLALAVTSDGTAFDKENTVMEPIHLTVLHNVRGGVPIEKIDAANWKDIKEAQEQQ
ncbi:beta-galactosidase [Zymomonas mobilis subsp. mobilis ZM4 = ATCC 31821]|uniref:beta-galactosidase n=4 Tax=Zymomonas mobilis TaxID=542 RepID=Q5NP32_ZYMMO|nr:beta-galactosidase [Zymomonas mobilis]AAV89528.1 Beta-galactosidase [Zymomonas mobilis subsp. mobilis ZM4 = ATCC 31821]AEH62246.1 Beta-galactosidase [Zymomonas mobilis subsp. mobilis ATCC 10988]AVZ25823.1 beta-galactosidase [Zymomonas mobilis subsp. mobilis]ACV74944.1 Beta-galactosidase [Zymomonas mobilis subsp. mobilis NCIMB 11163]AVZ42160.1 beta-galactosidase [Zymomonas mobilis subsp. mobilis ZM4 = ATCC 31821]